VAATAVWWRQLGGDSLAVAWRQHGGGAQQDDVGSLAATAWQRCGGSGSVVAALSATAAAARRRQQGGGVAAAWRQLGLYAFKYNVSTHFYLVRRKNLSLVKHYNVT